MMKQSLKDIYIFSSDSESDCSSDSDDQQSDKDVAERLAEWAIKFQITHSALLAILRRNHPELPKDPRTLLDTVKHVEVQSVAHGSYYQFGVSAAS